MCVGGLITTVVCCLVSGPVSERSLGSRFIEAAGLSTGLPSSLASSSFPLIQPQGSAASDHWLSVNICLWPFQLLVGSFRGMKGSHARSLFVSAPSPVSWDQSQFGPVTGTSFPQASLHFHPCSSFKQEQLWVRVLTVGCPTHSSLETVSFAEGGLYKFPLLNIGHFISGPSLRGPRVSHHPSLWCILEGPPNRLLPEVACFHSFFWPSGISVIFPHWIPAQVPLSAPPQVHFPWQIPCTPPPPPLVAAFFPLPSGTETSSLWPFSLLNFLSSVDCILGIWYFYFLANIYLLVSTYYACPFGSELPQSGWYFLVPSICLQNSGGPHS
jgi:hypothetical protein